MTNKIQYGLTNVHYSLYTLKDGVYTYEKPVRLYGAISAELSPLGETFTHYSDNNVTYSSSTNNGYEGTITLDTLPTTFRVDVLDEKLVNGLIVETGNAKPKSVALLFEIDGDAEASKFVFYNCSITRPTLSSETKGEGVTVNANELSFVASPRETDKAIRAFTDENTPKDIKDNFYDAVIEPVEIPTV